VTAEGPRQREPPSPRADLRESQIEDAFARALGLDQRGVNARPLRRGYGHESWILEAGDQRFLLKASVRRAAPEQFLSHINAHRLAGAHGLPVPEIVAVRETPNALNAPYVVQRWIPGEDGSEVMLRGVSQVDATRIGEELGRLVARIHTISGREFAELVGLGLRISSWRDLCRTRLASLVESNEHAGVLDGGRLHALAQRLARYLGRVPIVRPALTHSDLFLPNVVMRSGEVVGLLDWEHARFYDPVWDFVKLDAWVFRAHPELREPVAAGYAEHHTHQSFELRLATCQGLEYLAAVVYFGTTYPNATMLADFLVLIDEWLDRPEVGP
jgi:aminoglycoside phosphotransferase (APT) family kinase protein